MRWPPLLALDAVVVETHLAALLRGRLDGVVIDGLRATVEGEEQLATLRRVIAGDEEDGADPSADEGVGVRLAANAVPDRVGVHDARATATVGAIDVDLRLDTDLVRADDAGPWRGDLTAELQAEPVHVTAKLLASAGTARIGGQGPFELAIDGSFRPFDLDVRIDDLRSQGRLVLVADGGVPGAWLEMDATPLAGRFFGTDLRGTLPALSLQMQPGEEEPFAIEAEGGALRRVADPGRVENLAFTGSGGPEAFSVRASARLRDFPVAEAVLPPTAARATLVRAAGEDRVTLRLDVQGVAAPLQLDGVRASDSDALAFTVAPFALGPGGLDLVALAPGLLPGIENLSGRAEARQGRADLDTGALRFDLVLAGVEANTGAGEARGIDGTVAVRGPAPWRTAGPQTLAVTSVEAGLPFEDGRVVFELEQEGRLRVDAFDLRVAGGTARAEGPFHLDPDDARPAFQVEGVDLGLLLQEIAVEGLTGEGTLRGRLPFEWNGERARLMDGFLEATGPGVLSYRGGTAVASAASGGNDLEVLMQVLEDFHYDVLRVEAFGDLLGMVELVLHTEGRNPSFQEGREIDFTLNLEAPFRDLLGSTRWITAPPENLDELLQQLPPAETPSRQGDG